MLYSEWLPKWLAISTPAHGAYSFRCRGAGGVYPDTGPMDYISVSNVMGGWSKVLVYIILPIIYGTG